MATKTENTAAEPATLRQDKQDKYAAENMMLYRTSLALLKSLTEDGTFTPPSGVTTLRLILVGKGGDGTDGTDGTWYDAGVDGVDGSGGKVWSGTVNVNEGQTYDVTIDDEASTFGVYSSANGKTYQNGYTDVQSGDSYARTGVAVPKSGTGDGGAKGIGGYKGNKHTKTITVRDAAGNVYEKEVEVIDNAPGRGSKGKPGATGCVVVYWDKEAET